LVLDAVLSKTRPVWFRTNTVLSAIPEKPRVAWRILVVGYTGRQFFSRQRQRGNRNSSYVGPDIAGGWSSTFAARYILCAIKSNAAHYQAYPKDLDPWNQSSHGQKDSMSFEAQNTTPELEQDAGED
jgi:hypothetical protein